jgi:hypothetical protein
LRFAGDVAIASILEIQAVLLAPTANSVRRSKADWKQKLGGATMHVPDTTLVVSTIFHLAAQNGPNCVAPGQITSALTEQFGVNLPLHTVNEIISDLGLTTHTVGQYRYLVWDDHRMKTIKEMHIGRSKV